MPKKRRYSHQIPSYDFLADIQNDRSPLEPPVQEFLAGQIQRAYASGSSFPGDLPLRLSPDLRKQFPGEIPTTIADAVQALMKSYYPEMLTISSKMENTNLGMGDLFSDKIVINPTFGKLGFNNYWLYDPMAMLQVTVNGQLVLLMLVERMEANGIHCISANTDGIELYLPRELESLAIEIAHQWEQDTKFELEFTYYSKYIKRDVNNYIAVTTDGKVKTKGVFNQDINLKKGYKYPIIPKAVNAYFLNGIPVEQTIRNCKDIFDFCISQKIGKEYGMEMVTLADKKTASPASYSEIMKIRFLRTNGWRMLGLILTGLEKMKKTITQV